MSFSSSNLKHPIEYSLKMDSLEGKMVESKNVHLPAEMRWTRKAVNQTIWNAASDFLIRYVIASTWFQFIHLGLKIRAKNQDDQQLKTRLARRVFSRVWMTKVCHHFPRLGGEKKPRHTWGYLNFLPNAFVPLQPKARAYTHIHTHTHTVLFRRLVKKRFLILAHGLSGEIDRASVTLAMNSFDESLESSGERAPRQRNTHWPLLCLRRLMNSWLDSRWRARW